MAVSRASAFALLAAAHLLWAGNWVAGRALRDAFDPVSLNFWRWTIAALVLAPFTLAEVLKRRQVIRRHAGVLFGLSLTSVVLFQTLVYHGLHTTTALNGVLFNASAPLFVLLCSWLMERERASLRQVTGMLISFTGILVIMGRGELMRLAQLEFHSGDAWILLAMATWGVYAVLLKRRPPQLGGAALMLVLSMIGVVVMAPLYAVQTTRAPIGWPSTDEVLGVLYVGIGSSVLGFMAWNRGLAVVGPAAAGFTMHMLPAFGTLLAILLLGEEFRLFHAVGIATIVVGVVLATRRG